MALRGANQESGRPYNRRIILEAIRLQGPVTRAELAKQVGLSLQTVSTITAELLEQGFLVLRREPPRGRGFPAPKLQVNPDGGYACGLYVTPRGIDAGLVNMAGEIVARETVDTPQLSPDDAFAHIARLLKRLRKARPGGRMLGVGMSMPGPFEVDSMSFVGPTTMQGWEGVSLHERLRAATGLPAFIETDNVAAAHGECLYGAGGDYASFYYLYLGVGLGGCAVHKGLPVRGGWGNAGELGHVPLVPGGDRCPCGNQGCLERYISLEAYERRVPEVGEAAWLEEIAPIFRSTIVTIENLFDPETIILGGIGSPDLNRKLRAIADELPNSVAARRDRTAERLVVSDVGADAVLLGAAALAVSGTLSPQASILFNSAGNAPVADPLMNDIDGQESA